MIFYYHNESSPSGEVDHYGLGYWVAVICHLLLFVILLPIIILAIIGFYIYVWKFEKVPPQEPPKPRPQSYYSDRR